MFNYVPREEQTVEEKEAIIEASVPGVFAGYKRNQDGTLFHDKDGKLVLEKEIDVNATNMDIVDQELADFDNGRHTAPKLIKSDRKEKKKELVPAMLNSEERSLEIASLTQRLNELRN